MKIRFAILLLNLLVFPCAEEIMLRNIHLKGDGRHAWALLQFSSKKEPYKVPRFFQHFNGVKSLFSVNFLATHSGVPFKRYTVKQDNPFVSHIILKKTKHKKVGETRHFLSVVFLCQEEMNKGRYPVSKAGEGMLKLALGEYTGIPFAWSLSETGKNKPAIFSKPEIKKNIPGPGKMHEKPKTGAARDETKKKVDKSVLNPVPDTINITGSGSIKKVTRKEFRKETNQKRFDEQRKKREARQNAIQAEKERMQTQKEKEALRLKEEKAKIQKIKEKQKEEEQEAIDRFFEKKRVNYASFGSRDPFIPIKEVPFNDDDINIDQMKLVGIIWDEKDPMAILEHRQETGVSLAVRKGDKISNGWVSQVTRSDVVFEISEYGIIRSYTMRLVSLDERMAR